MASARRPRRPGPDPGPAVFVLFGATGDLAKRMVLPAFYTLAIEGLLPEDWLLVGNGRGDVAHEDFRKHVHDVLTEFGPHPEKGQWQKFADRLLFAGGGFNTDDPGSLLDVIGDARETPGLADRAEFYDATGAVLDMLVTHLFQVAAEVAMEPPASLEAADLQSAREKVIRAFRPIDPAEAVLAQFDGYKDVPGIK